MESLKQNCYSEEAGQALARRTAVTLGSIETVVRLTYFKWRYNLESIGFTNPQAKQLIFLKWLYINRRGSLF